MRIVAPLIIISLVLLSACAAAEKPAVVPSDTTGAMQIQMVASGFDPDTVTVKRGARVCFVNADTQARWPASNIHPTHEIYSDFDPKKPVRAGDTWCFAFTKPGIWKFHDHLLPEFAGTVTVEE